MKQNAKPKSKATVKAAKEKEKHAIAYWQTATYSNSTYSWSNSDTVFYLNDYVYVSKKLNN